MDYEQKYKEAFERARNVNKYSSDLAEIKRMEHIFPELRESEDEKIKNRIIQAIKIREKEMNEEWSDEIAWIEKQGDNLIKKGYTNNKDVIKYASNYSRAIWHKLMDNFKNIKDYHIGCNDVSDIVLNAIIDTYNWLEKQGKKEFTFKSIPRLLEMIEHTDRAKSYCQKLIDSLVKEGYTADAKIVEACLKQMNGENVAMAVMDKKPLIIISKFRVGDEVVTKNEESLTITRIDEEGYWSNDLFICGFDDSDEWELVEQKPDNKIEPKFHEGDWVVWDNKISCHIDNIYQGKESLMYTITDTNNMIRSYSVKSFDNNAHLWSIEDAKDGDVLVNGNEIVIFKKSTFNEKDLSGCMFVHCQLRDKNGYWYTIGGINPTNYTPATKEQRDLLSQKMHEAGYEWNTEKKELKLLITNGGDFESENCEQKSATWGEEQGEQKPIDKIQLGKKYKCIASPRYSTFRRGNIYKPVDNFLCNLMNLCYECFEPIEDSEQKPSDNDMVEALRTEYEKGRADVIAEMQKEWSEEDESNLNGILDCYKSMDIKWRNWLKSIKDRVQPRSSWKPTKVEDELKLFKTLKERIGK